MAMDKGYHVRTCDAPKSKRLMVYMTDAEKEEINDICATYGISFQQLVFNALDWYKNTGGLADLDELYS